MVVNIPSTWPERSTAFVQACLKNYNSLPPEEAFNHCITSAGELAEANFSLVLSFVNSQQAKIIVSSESIGHDKIVNYNFKKSETSIFELIEISSIILAEPLTSKANYLFSIPLHEKDFSGTLLFGYERKPENIKELTEFAQLVQGVCQERLRLNRLMNSLENSRQRFDNLLHSIPEAVVILEYNRVNAWTNQAAAVLLSLPEGPVPRDQVVEAIKILSQKAENAGNLEKELKEFLPINQKEIENWPWYFTEPTATLLHVSCSSIEGGNTSDTIWTFKNVSHKLDSRFAQDQIQELSNLLSSVLNSSQSGIMAFQSIRDGKGEIMDFKCLIANESAKKLVRKQEHEVIGNNLLKILPENLKEGLFEKYIKVVETGDPFYLEHYYLKEGEKRWSQTIASKLKDGFVVTFSDISKRKNAEEKLRQNQANLEALLENTDDFIWSLSTDFRITAINTSFQEKVLHQTAHSLRIGDHFDINIFPQNSIKKWKKFFSRVLKGEQFTEEVQIHIDEKDYYFDYSFNPIFDEKGNVTGITIFGRNITARINSEQIIRNQSQMLNSLLNNLPVIVFRVDEGGNITESMGAALNNLDKQEKKFSGNEAIDLFPEIKKEISKLKKGKNRNFMSKTIIEGNKFYFENYIFPDETNPGGAIGFAIDVTELKQIEQELKIAKDTADKASQTKSYFLANMSHDIRTPIHTILGFAQALKNKDLSPATSIEYLNYIISSGELLYKLVDDILELTKIEEGKLELKEEPFHFKETLLSNLHPYQFQAHEKGLGFELKFDESIPDYIIGDAGKISRIVINLLSNSLKFTKKGFIKVSFNCLIIQANEQAKDKLKVTVTDTGLGIPKEKQSIIFNSFTQAEPSINRKFGGSGLGLAIVRELVELMGGELGVISPVNKNSEVGGSGSTFWFTFPLKSINSPEIVKNIDPQNDEIHYNEKLKVLLVEDNNINQQLVKVMLEKIGCKVTLADNGLEAVDLIRTIDFGLILMDVQMPVMDGMEATRKIRKEINKSIPIIGLSAHIYNDDIEKCLDSGMTDFLGKPFSEKALQAKIKEWVPINFNFTYPNQPVKDAPTTNMTDLSFLTNLYNGDWVAIKEMIKDFILFQNQLLDQMEENFKNNDYKKLAGLAHKMRSSIRTVGLESLYAPLVNLENHAIESNDEVKINDSLNNVKKLCQQATEELKSYI